MKNGKMLILLMTTVFVLLVIVTGSIEPAPEPDAEVNMPLAFAAVLDGRQEEITCWEDDTGACVVFLPSGAEITDVTVSVEAGARVLLDQVPLENGSSCGKLLLDTAYPLSCTVGGVTRENTLIFLRSARLPSLHLDVLSGSMEIIHSAKGNRESGSLRLYSASGELTYSGGVESLKGRGNSSWFEEKKPYSLTLRAEGDLLGMGKAKEWILLANALDPSHLRNKVVYDTAAKAGMPFAPECQWVDLYLNGEYAGLYLLSERNEIHPERVDLPEAGSFLVSRESGWRLISQNYPHVLLDSGAALRIHDSGLTEEAIYRIWQPVENAILAEDGIDPVTGRAWQELIDLDSWAMEYLLGEIFGNVDTGTISAYYYRDGSDPSGKLCAGPVWDYDLSMGNERTWQAKTVQAFFGDKAHIWSLEDSTWFYSLNRKTEFRDRVGELYQAVFWPLLQELLDTGLDDYLKEIQAGAILDQRRWGNGNAGEETEQIRQYLSQRREFLDSVWLEGQEYCKALVILDENSSAICHAVLPGGTVPELPAYEESWDVLGWYDAETEQPFDISQPIYRDTVVYLKRLPAPEAEMSRLQFVPIAVAAVILACTMLAEGKRCRKQAKKREKPIAKWENV